MHHPPIVSHDEWQAARDALLVREKAHTRAGDALAAERRRLPMVQVDSGYVLQGPEGPVPFLDVFEGRRQLVFTDGRGVEHLGAVFTYMDLMPYGRQQEWEDSPEGWPQTETYSGCPGRFDEYTPAEVAGGSLLR